jgi:hypothetical protein
MERLFDELIGHVWAVKVAGIDAVHAGGDGLAQNSGRTGNIARGPQTCLSPSCPESCIAP